MEGSIIELFRLGSNEVVLSHLQFADDTMLFCSSKEHSFFILHRMGNFLNPCLLLKSVGASVKLWGSTATKRRLRDGWRCLAVRLDSFPLVILGNSRAMTFWNPIFEKICKRLASWKKSLFSQARRLTLIRLVLSSILVYYFSFFWALVLFVKAWKKFMRDFLR